MSRLGIQMLGISKANWNGKESFNNCENQMTISSGKDDNYSHEVAVILDRESSRAPIDYSPVRDNKNVGLMQCLITFQLCNAMLQKLLR